MEERAAKIEAKQAALAAAVVVGSAATAVAAATMGVGSLGASGDADGD